MSTRCGPSTRHADIQDDPFLPSRLVSRPKSESVSRLDRCLAMGCETQCGDTPESDEMLRLVYIYALHLRRNVDRVLVIRFIAWTFLSAFVQGAAQSRNQLKII